MAPGIDVVPHSLALGAEVRGIDLFRTLDDEAFECVRSASVDYQRRPPAHRAGGHEPAGVSRGNPSRRERRNLPAPRARAISCR